MALWVDHLCITGSAMLLKKGEVKAARIACLRARKESGFSWMTHPLSMLVGLILGLHWMQAAREFRLEIWYSWCSFSSLFRFLDASYSPLYFPRQSYLMNDSVFSRLNQAFIVLRYAVKSIYQFFLSKLKPNCQWLRKVSSLGASIARHVTYPLRSDVQLVKKTEWTAFARVRIRWTKCGERAEGASALGSLW